MGFIKIQMSKTEYRKLCANVSDQVEYRYISNETHPDHVTIPNKNEYVKCKITKKNYCVFKVRNKLIWYSADGSEVFVKNTTCLRILCFISAVFAVRRAF